MPYLNHAGTSWPKPPAVVAAANAVLHSDPTQWPQLFADASTTVADFFQVDSARLLLTPGCTAALQLAIQDQPWQPGDRVITSHFEHHAMQRSLSKLSGRGVTVTVLPPDDTELISLGALKHELRQGSVRLVALTAACNVTGQLLPISAATELARQFGAISLIDGAQIAGWRDLDVTASGADIFAFAGHKGPQSPWGVGGLYVRADLPMQCPTAACNIDEARASTTSIMPGYCDAGSVNLAALAGLAAGCQWLQEPAQQDRLQAARELASAFTEAVRPLSRVTVHHDVPLAKKMPTVAISVAGVDQADLAGQLRQRGMMISAGFQCSPQSHKALGTDQSGVLRFSFGPGNQSKDVCESIEILSELLT